MRIPPSIEEKKAFFSPPPGRRAAVTWVIYCWVGAAGLSEPLLHCDLFYNHL